MDKSKIERINELGRKMQESGLTEDEKKEQAQLRQEYLAAFRQNFSGQLESIYIQREDGSYEKLSKKEPSTPAN